MLRLSIALATVKVHRRKPAPQPADRAPTSGRCAHRFGRVPIIDVVDNPAAVVKANAVLPGTRYVAAQPKPKLPAQHGITLTCQRVADHKAGLLKRGEHMAEDAVDFGKPDHVIEWVPGCACSA